MTISGRGQGHGKVGLSQLEESALSGPRVHSHSPADFCQNWPAFSPLLESEKLRNIVHRVMEIYIFGKYILQDMIGALSAGGKRRGTWGPFPFNG